MQRLPWYRDKSRLAAAVAQHGSVEAAARAHGTPSSTVGEWARRLGVRGTHPKTPGVAFIEKRTTDPGVTYLVGAEGSPLVKIGRTGGDPAARLANMQTGSPVRLFLICTLPHSRWEDVLHHHFHDKRRQGEWFALTPADVRRVRAWVS